MALEIKENKGIFELCGNLSAQNLGAVRIYFQTIVETHDNLVISLEKLTHLDPSAAKFLEQFYRKMAGDNKVISIVGRQNKEIREVMSLTQTEYVLSADRI